MKILYYISIGTTIIGLIVAIMLMVATFSEMLIERKKHKMKNDFERRLP